MSYTILYEKPALKFIQKQPKEQQRRILEAVHALPDSGDIKQLKGHTGLLRLRVGSYRIIYTVDNGRLIVRIIDAGNRGQIYNRYYLQERPPGAPFLQTQRTPQLFPAKGFSALLSVQKKSRSFYHGMPCKSRRVSAFLL